MAAALSGPATDPVLERLKQLDIINIHQTSYGYNGNNYTVLSGEEPLFTMNEVVPDTIFRGGARRPFLFDGVDNTGRKFFGFQRRRGNWLISRKVELFINNQLASIIRAEKTMSPIFTINDPQLQPMVRLKGKLTDYTVFQLQANTKVHIGSINKRWLGWKKELTSRNNNFIINFPIDLAVQYKLAVIVACVYIDFTFFEGK